MQNDYLRGFTLVIMSGAIWSFSAPLVRLLEDAEAYRLQFLLYRSLIVISVVLIYILFREGRNFLNTFKRIDSWSLFGGFSDVIHIFWLGLRSYNNNGCHNITDAGIVTGSFCISRLSYSG